jgi:hypothetical protein
VRAREEVAARHGPLTRATFLSRRLHTVASHIQAREEGVASALRRAETRLQRGLEIGGPSRYGKLTRFYRRVVRRALRSYDANHRETIEALIDAIKSVRSDPRRGSGES